MVEIERNPLAVRQGAAAVACIAAAAVAMPVISHRAAEQRDGAEWAARSEAFQIELQQQLAQGRDPDANIELTAFRTDDGLKARGRAGLFADMTGAHAMLVEAALRGPLAPMPENLAMQQPNDEVSQRELHCMAEAIYHEARGETYEGQVAVGEVVMNRVRSRLYPNSVCGVVYQGSHRLTGCQFTFTCDGSLNRRPRGRAWEQAQHIATLVINGYTRPVTQRATHYHTNKVNPIWSSGLVQTATIGSHVFYRFPTRAEAPAYQEALLRRRATFAHRGGSHAAAPSVEDAVLAAEAQEADLIENVLETPGDGEIDVDATPEVATPAAVSATPVIGAPIMVAPAAPVAVAPPALPGEDSTASIAQAGSVT